MISRRRNSILGGLTASVVWVGLGVYAPPAMADPPGTIQEFSINDSAVPPPDPDGIALGPDGNIWFTEKNANRIGKMTPAGVVTEYTANLSPGAEPFIIAAGPDGNLWFTETKGNRIGKITTSGTITEYTAAGWTPGNGPDDPGPDDPGVELWGITAGPDGNMWFTEASGDKVGRITPAGVITEFPVTAGADPLGITLGSDNHLWFTEASLDQIGRMSQTGVLTNEYSAGMATDDPVAIATGQDGNMWFVYLHGHKIGRITPTGTINEFSNGLTPLAGPRRITAGPDGSMYFTESGANKIGRINPEGKILEFSGLTDNPAGLRGIITGPDGNLWFSEASAHKIGQLTTPTAPGQTTGVNGTPGNAQVSLSWTAPTSNGGALITGYKIEVNDGTSWTTAVDDPGNATTTRTITGLTNGTQYKFRVSAINGIGTGSASPASADITPYTVPGKTTNVTGEPGDSQVTLSWTAPPANGSPITGYTIEVKADGTWTTAVANTGSPATSRVVTGLSNGTQYRFRVTAINLAGPGTVSDDSALITPLAVPDAPTNVTGVAGDAQVQLSWTAPAFNGGNPISGYRIDVSSGGAWTTAIANTGGTATSQVISSLTNGTGYRFRVAAINSFGTGPVSEPSATLTPAAPVTPTPPVTPPASLTVDARAASKNVKASGKAKLVKDITVGSGQTASIKVKVTPKKTKKKVTVTTTSTKVKVKTDKAPKGTVKVTITVTGPGVSKVTWTRSWKVG
ncbi:MAG: fibronectin type III domain-containing protein [Candidatus Nanopelagicales bacterium]